MIFLPLWYWFGDAHIGRGCVCSSLIRLERSADFRWSARLLHVLAIGRQLILLANR